MILVIDDEPRVLRVIQRALEFRGREVVVYATGESAVQAFEREPDTFAFALLDLSMPGMGGAATYDALRAERAELPIIVMSGSPESLKSYASRSHTLTLNKPFRLDALFAVVESVDALTDTSSHT